MTWSGILTGLICFLVIGIFHPIVIRGEYYFGTKLWIAFLLGGLASLAGSLFVEQFVVSAGLGVLGFTCLWSILEVFEQKKRVEKGWFPAGPSHRKDTSGSGK